MQLKGKKVNGKIDYRTQSGRVLSVTVRGRIVKNYVTKKEVVVKTAVQEILIPTNKIQNIVEV